MNMKKTASILAAMLALGLFMAACDRDKGAGESQNMMENSGDSMSNNAAGQGQEAPAQTPPAESTPPAEQAPAEEGQQ
jgi:predicted small secreted protein